LGDSAYRLRWSYPRFRQPSRKPATPQKPCVGEFEIAFGRSPEAVYSQEESMMMSENRMRSRDRSFWILFSAGWVIYTGLMAFTALVEKDRHFKGPTGCL